MKQIKKVIDWFMSDVMGYEDNDPELEMMEEDMYMSWMDMDDSHSKENKFSKSEMPSDVL